MRKVKYTEFQIEELNRNPYVKNCTSKNINFTKEAKLSAVKMSEEFLSAKEIFFDL